MGPWPEGHSQAGWAATEPAAVLRAVSCRPLGWGSGPSMAWSFGPGCPGPTSHRAGSCLGWAKKTCLVPGHRAAGCMPINNRRRPQEPEIIRS
jgi:hypothetical protein